MKYIKIRHNFLACKTVPPDENEKKDDNVYYSTNAIYKNYIFCSYCKKMNEAEDFLQVTSGKEKMAKVMRYYENNLEFFALYFKNDKKNIETISSESMKEDLAGFDVEFTKQGKPVLICPECKKRIAYNSLELLKRANRWIDNNSFIHAYDISDKEDSTVLSVYTYSIYPSIEGGKLKYTEINSRFVFNNKTKQIYALQPIFSDNMKPVYKKQKKITNITYFVAAKRYLMPIQEHILEDDRILNALDKHLHEKNGEEFHPSPGYTPSMDEIATYFRYCKLNSEVRSTINYILENEYTSSAQRQKRKVLLQKVFLMQDSYEVMLEEMKKKKLPFKKRIKKMVIEDPFCIYIYRFLTKLGMKDYNVILDCIEYIKPQQGFFVKIYLGLELLDWEYNSENIKDFLKFFIKEKGDVATKKSIFEDIYKTNGNQRRVHRNLHFLIDSSRLYRGILDITEGEMEIPLGKNLLEIHENLSKFYSKCRHVNRQIPYCKNDFRLNAKYGDYIFLLADTTYSLVDCGEKMGICVAIYGAMAVSKKCAIVFLIHKGKYAGCIELTPDFKRLKQAKAKFNNYITGEAACVLKQWIEDNGIDASTCSDYNHIANGNFDVKTNSTYNYSMTNRLDDPDELNYFSSNMDYKIVDDEEIQNVEEKNLEYKAPVPAVPEIEDNIPFIEEANIVPFRIF